MARIDSFLAQLIAYEADALLVEAGDNLYLQKGEHKQPLMQVKAGAIANAHVVALLDEIAPDEVKACLAFGEPITWDHRWGTCLFQVEVAFAEGRIVARLRAIADPTVVTAIGVASSSPAGSSSSARGDGDDDGDGAPAIARFFRALGAHASDLFLTAGRLPMARVDGDMVPLQGFAALDAYGLQKMIEEILPDGCKAALEHGDADFAATVDGARVRCNVFRDVGGVGGVFRRFAPQLRTLESLGLHPTVVDLCRLRAGLVVVSGAASSGRSTTLAAMIDWINGERRDHVVTIEDPIEVVHAPKRCLINQRQLGEHTNCVARALLAARREDPDVVVVGDLRTGADLRTCLDLADEGRLVIAVCSSSSSSANGLARLIEQLPADQQDAARSALRRVLQGTVHQVLCKKSGGGSVVAAEVFIGGDGDELPGRCSLNQALRELVALGVVERDEALRRSNDPAGFLGGLKVAA